jgi:tRNA(adenine34) deaminase
MDMDERYMELAIEQSIEAKANGEWPFGAVIVLGNKVIAQNRCREGHEKTVLAHAEMHAVNDACKALGRSDLNDCTIYCTNEPCLMCSAAIMQARIPRIVIALARHDLSHLLRERKIRIEHLAEDSGYNPEIVHGVLKEKAQALFADVKKN